MRPDWSCIARPDDLAAISHEVFSSPSDPAVVPLTIARCKCSDSEAFAWCNSRGCVVLSHGRACCAVTAEPHELPPHWVPVTDEYGVTVHECPFRESDWQKGGVVREQNRLEPVFDCRTESDRRRARRIRAYVKSLVHAAQLVPGLVGITAEAFITDDWTAVDAKKPANADTTEWRLRAQRELWHHMTCHAKRDDSWKEHL